MLHNKKILLVFLFFIACLFCFNFNTSYAADVDSFKKYVEDNKAAWNEALEGYDYIIINNPYMSWLALYYTNGSNNIFTLSENGSTRHLLSSTSDLGTDKYDVIVLNDGTHNNFWVPTTLQTTFEGVTGNNNLVNDFSLDKVVYSSGSFYLDGVLIEDKLPVPQPEPPAPTELAKITQEAEPEKALAEIVKIIPMVIIAVVSYLALRKALSMLLTLLRQS